MLREYAAEKNIDLGSATRRQDIIDIIEAATAPPTGAADAPEANTPPEEENATEGENNATGDSEAGDPEETKTDDAAETEQGSGKQPATPEEKPPENETKTDEAAKVEQSPGGVVIKRLLFASRLLMKGEDVDAVHAALIKKGLHVGQDSVQGIYGAKTAVAVRHFQAKNRLIVDGKVGKFTAQALGFTWDDTPAK